jgi:hypothetical protein
LRRSKRKKRPITIPAASAHCSKGGGLPS